MIILYLSTEKWGFSIEYKSRKYILNLMMLKVTTLSMTPVIKTKRRLGSHWLFSNRKPWILDLWDIPAVIKPIPKTNPIDKRQAFSNRFFFFYIKKAIKITVIVTERKIVGFTICSGIDICSKKAGVWGRWLLMPDVATAIAVNKNTITAVNDLKENLGKPQRPWPLVHPFPSSVPTPTRNPATTKLILEAEKVYASES